MSQIQQRFASFGKHKPISGDFVPKSTKGLGVSNLRATDHRNFDRAIGWGLMAVVGIAFWAGVAKVFL